jgi:N4-gp56 family major capsid protein
MLTKIADIPQQMLDIYSRELIMDQIPKMYFRQFVDYKLEFGTQPGERIMFTKLDNLNTNGKLLDEDTPIPKNKMTGSALYISVSEFGNAASFSRRASVASLRNMLDDAKRVLGRDYNLTMDGYLRDVFQTTANKHYTKSDHTSGTVVGEVAGMFDKYTLDELVETAKNMNFPYIDRGGDRFFAFIGTAHQIRQIRSTSGWLDARRYVNPSDMLFGEAGRLENVVFLDTTQMQSLGTIGSGAVGVERGMLIGGGPAVGYGESIPMELIPGDQEDFGRKQSIAWYMIGGAGILNDYLIDVYTARGLVTLT